MAYNIKFSLMLAAAAGLMLAGCQKQDNLAMNDGDAPLSFAVGIVGDAGFDHSGSDGWSTKADNRISTLTQFKVKGFEGSSDWFPETTVSTSSMAYSDYIWHTGVEHTFYACANLPTSGATASIASTGVTLNYTAVPTSQADQKDILLGSYAGKGNKGEAEIQFYHPLTAIAFKVDAITDVTAIKSITLDGAYKSGSVTLSETSGTPAFAWTASETQNGVSQTISVTSFTEGTKLGDPFILIPQNLAAKNLTVKIVATVGGADKTVTATLKTGSLPAGKTTTYAVSYDATKGLNFSTPVVSNWGTGDSLAEEMEDRVQKDNEIWYTTTDGKIIPMHSCYSTDNTYFGAKLVSNTYSNGKGILKFDGNVTQLFRTFGWQESDRNSRNLKSLQLPSTVKSIKNTSFYSLSGADIIEIYLPDGLQTFEYQAFYGCNMVSTKYKLITSVDSYLLVYSSPSLHLNDASGPTSVTIQPQNITLNLTNTNCFIKGTLITMADGSKKPVEDLEYGDVLKVWNFDEGHEDTADILWMTKRGIKNSHYYKCTFSDGTVLNVTGGGETGGTHRMFTSTKGMFEHPYKITDDDKIYTDHGLVKLVSYERIDEEVEFFNLITTEHINCYANGVLTSARYNNRYPIDKDMKFVKDGRKIRPYREFRKTGISREWYNGMRLGEQQDSIARVKAYIDKCEANARPRPDDTEPIGFFARIWNWINRLFS